MGLLEPVKTTRAKFRCSSVLKTMNIAKNLETGTYEPRAVFTYRFGVVSSGSEENERFFASTPSGNLDLSALREDLFELNKEYYVDFQLSND